MITKIPRMETIKATAKLFGLPQHFVRQKVLSGEIIAVRAGCKYLVNVDRFADYLNSHVEGNHTGERAAEQGGITPIPVNL